MKNHLLLTSFGFILIITLLFVVWIAIFGIPLPAKKYTYTGPRKAELQELAANSSLPKDQAQLEQVLDAVYISDIQTFVSLTQNYYKDYSELPWQQQSRPQLARDIQGISKLQLTGGMSDDSFQKMLSKDIYLVNDGKNVYWCADLLRDNDRELWKGTWCNSTTNCYCDVFPK